MSATSQGSTIKLDLASQFGHEKPEISIHFATLEEAGSFVRSYAFNEGKSVKRNDVTPHAMKLFNTEKLLVARQTVVVGDEPIFYVFDAFGSRSNTSNNAHVYEVNMYAGVCTRCTVSEQLRIPCRHIQAVINDRSKYKDAGVAQYDVRKYFHSAYLVRHLLDAVELLSIQLPLEAELLDSNDVKPPPMYRQAGRSSTRMPVKDTPDLVRGSKRKQNRGEDASRSRYCGGEGLNIAVKDLSDEESKRVSAFFF
ncbi:hypothetical protein AM587_10001301 [Phytophthora nicotianae]|uniref:SWIM-type domain-containing protein n=1 Tax=Phytophthora nicotianae TaxID=4792 RepID=A0A0W8CAM5_PHYNI|nr:hypothetical protein AM587_10001301 [Phytophthora nicotianae]